MSSKIEESKGINATFILEIIGRPPEHLVETLENLIKTMDNEKGVRVKSKKINEPVLVKDQKNLYTTFAEVDVEVGTILQLAVLMFKYMPAHIEVISPELLVLSNSGWNDILNELTRRLHGYDEVARMLMAEKSVLEQQLRGIAEGRLTVSLTKPENKNDEAVKEESEEKKSEKKVRKSRKKKGEEN